MRRLTIDDVKGRKNYNRNVFRGQVKLLQLSLVCIVAQSVIVCYLYFSQPEPLYFSTNSASAIRPLVMLMEPNMSEEALLAPDIPEEMGLKELKFN